MAIIALVSSAQLMAADKVQYGKPGDWVLPPPSPTDGATPAGAAARIIYSDIQTRVGAKGDEVYTTWRIKLLTADALPIGNLTASWNPSAGGATIHHLRIIRGDKSINILAANKFAVVRQESSLESAVLHGMLTASLQTPGLQVGDELEFAATVWGRDPTLGDHHFGLSALSPLGNPGAYRMRISWPAKQAVRWRASADLGTIAPVAQGEDMVIEQLLRDPRSAVPTEGAPARYNFRRLLEYSDFSGWEDISTRMSALFDTAASLKPDSPLRAEIARIAAESADPTARVQAALALVQEQIRYVYVGLNGGNYRPATVDESWTRRFGDCKAKTALLLAILRELGIPAEAVLVPSTGGDGMDQRLPSPTLFDHVLVRATIDGKTHWLDGTRQGDRYLSLIPPPSYRWILPLRTGGAPLEAVEPKAPKEPQFIETLDVDVRGGIDKPAKASIRHILRGDEVYAMRASLAALTPEDADRQLQAYWRQQADWVEPEKVEWRYVEDKAALVLSMTGEGKLEWKGDGARYSYINGAGFYAPSSIKRPKDQDQEAPFAISFPRFRCWSTTMRLPKPTGNWHWNLSGKRVNRTLGGIAYWRGLSIRDNVVRTVQSSRSVAPEISAQEAKIVNDAISRFDSNKSYVEQDSTLSADVGRREPMLEAGDAIDWLASDTPCQGPGAQ